MAEILNEQYSSIFSTPSTDLKKEDLNDFFAIPEEQDLDEILHTINFTKQGVQEVLAEMSETSAPGPDGLPVGCLKQGGQGLAEFLAKFMNQSMTEADVPLLLRLMMISPIYKGKDKSMAVNYRPVALTLHIIKLMERCVRKVMVYFLELKKTV